MQAIKVLVPEDRVADFYMWFGGWLAGPDASPSTAAPGPRLRWQNTTEDRALAEELWMKLSERAQALFGLLMDHPDAKYTGDELADTLDIPNGSRGVAGVLAWPGRHTIPMNRWLPSEYDEESGTYWMTSEVADLFTRVRNEH